MIDFEIGDVTLWVSHDGGKPYPVCVYRKDGQWLHQTYREDLNELEHVALEGLVKQVLGDMNTVWRGNMKTRLLWDRTKLRRKKTLSTHQSS